MNAIRTVLNSLSLILVAAMAFLPQVLGCTVSVGGVYDCTGSWLPPTWALVIAAILQAANLIMKAMQGGTVAGALFKPTAVVDATSSKPGTVAPSAVNK